MRKNQENIILALFAIIVIGPVLYYHIPPYYFTPDILYVKAKLLAVMQGSLFSDPVTGFPTMHPPFYHLVLAVPALIGISTEALPLLVSIFNVVLTLVFTYLVISRLFNSTVGLFTALLIPFINQHMGPSYLFLATAFYFSIPFFLAGLWLYLKPKQTMRHWILTGVLWGITFLISPGYVFVIGLFFLYELGVQRNFRRVIYTGIPFALALTPFYVQLYLVQATGMAGTSAFSLWRGIPDGEWMDAFFRYFLSPADGRLSHWYIIPAMAIFISGVVLGIRSKKARPYIIIFGAAWLLTAYHFNYFQYGPRIYFFLSLFLAAVVMEFIFSHLKGRAAVIAGIAFLSLISFDYLRQTVPEMSEYASSYDGYREIGAGLRTNLGKYITPGSFVLADEQTYRNFIMPYFPVKALVAHKTGEYYQVNSKLSAEMLDDLNYFRQSTTAEQIDFICRKYRMTVAVFGGNDKDISGFEVISRIWRQVYRDRYFVIYVQPEGQNR